MAGRGDIDRFILEPCQRRVSPLPEGEARADELTESVLCVDDAEKIALLGEAVEHGEYPPDFETLGALVRDICYNNAKAYFSI